MSLREKAEAFRAVDTNYKNSWWTEADIYQALGVYRETANSTNLRPSQTHLDLGCGFGDLLGELRQRQQESTLIGVDVNPSMLLAGGENRLRPRGISAQYFIKQGYQVRPNGAISRTFQHDKDFPPLQKDKINLIADEIRSLAVLKHLLGHRRLDSGSIMLPGSSLSLAFEDYTGEKLDTNDKQRHRIVEVVNQTRAAAYQFMAGRIAQGGSLVLVERAHLDPCISAEAAGQQLVAQRLGPNAKFWDRDHTKLIKMSDTRDGALYSLKTGTPDHVELVHSAGSTVSLVTDGPRAGIDNVTVIIQKLVRNRKRPKRR